MFSLCLDWFVHSLSLSLHLTVADSSSARQELRRIWRRIARSFVHALQHSSLAIRRCRLLHHSLHYLLRWKRLEGESLRFSTPSISPFFKFRDFSPVDGHLLTRRMTRRLNPSPSSRNSSSSKTERNTTKSVLPPFLSSPLVDTILPRILSPLSDTILTALEIRCSFSIPTILSTKLFSKRSVSPGTRRPTPSTTSDPTSPSVRACRTSSSGTRRKSCRHGGNIERENSLTLITK